LLLVAAAVTGFTLVAAVELVVWLLVLYRLHQQPHIL
jgi:hypothetical protein